MNAKIIHVNNNRLQELKWNVEKNIKRENYIKDIIFPLFKLNNFNCSFFDAVMIPDFKYDRRGSELYVKNYDKFIEYNQEKIKVGLNKNDPPRNYEIALFLGHYNLWKESIDKNEPLLIMEDDVFFDETSISYTLNIVNKFKNESNKLLYLQSISPSNPKNKKIYDEKNLEDNGYYYKVSKNHGDFSGTCCYFITPSSAKILISFIDLFGIICIDGFIHNCHKKTNLDICIPKQYHETAKLHLEHC